MRIRLVALLSLLAASALATEYTRFAPLWVEDPRPGARPEACRLFALLNLPPGWMAGDAAAVRLSSLGAPADPDAERLTAALLHAGAAVLELASGGDCVPETARRLARDPLADLFGALVALRREAGAGLVLAIGIGALGPQVLAAADPGLAAAYLGEGAAGFVAAVALGAGGEPAIRAGQAPPAQEGWAVRAPLFCDLLHRVAAEGGAAVPDRAACLAALVDAPGRAPTGLFALGAP